MSAASLMRGIIPQTTTKQHHQPFHAVNPLDLSVSGPDPKIFNMAPVPLEQHVNYQSVALVAGHVIAAVFLTVGVGRSLYRSKCALGPSQDTRERRHSRATLIPVFAILALLSLGSASYAALQHAVLSYKVWAGERDIAVPLRIYGDKGIFRFGENATDVYPGLWMSDTSVQLDSFEILAERARRFWWGQQIEMGLIPWNLFLSVEGRRRNMPNLWAYSLLGQLVSLSFGQNLFFIALLLTPSPLPPRVGRFFTPKPSTWTPSTFISASCLGLAYAALWNARQAVNDPNAATAVLLSIALTVLPLVLPYLLPTSCGRTLTSHRETHQAYATLFKLASLGSFVLHVKASYEGLLHSAPSAYYHRHSKYLPFDVEKRSAWERTTSAFGRILSATSDHPVVSGAGFDVLLSGTSLGLWAAVRATDVADILAASIPWYTHAQHERDLEHRDADKSPRAVATKTHHDEPAPSPRRRGRPRKVKRESDSVSDASYEPTPSEAAALVVGDEVAEAGELDWESSAVAWGLTALGGLGAGSAGVLGSECVAR